MVTTAKKKRAYLVWETEYPDEGSFEMKATSPAHARALYRTVTGEPDVELGVCLLTPALAKERAVREKASAKGLTCLVCNENTLGCRCASFATKRKPFTCSCGGNFKASDGKVACATCGKKPKAVR